MIYVALLRGINVGGNARLPMKDLAGIFQSAGAKEVRTYIQSGNVVFTAPAPVALIAAVTAQIVRQFGYPGRIVLRSAEELREVHVANPFPGVPEESLHVSFLADYPTPSAVASLDPNRSPGDSFAVIGREIYLHLPNGMGRSRLGATYLDAKLKTIGTVRNWKTVTKLLELSR